VTTFLGVAAVGAAANVYRRAQQVAEQEGRPLGEVLREMPTRLVSNFESMGDDLRAAADDGKQAAQDRQDEIDEELRDVYGQPSASEQPTASEQPSASEQPPASDA
jgi:hypothetical protein